MKRIIALLPLLLLLPAALATTLTATSPLYSNSVIEYSGTCASSGKTVGVQISFNGNMVHFDQLTATGTTFTSSSSTTTYTASNDGSYVISASCDGESSASTTVCVGSSCPSETPEEEESDSGSGGGSSSGLVVVGGSDSSGDSGDESASSAGGAPTATGGGGGGAASSSGTATQEDEPVIDELEEIPTYVPDKTPSKEGSGLKYSIIAAISLLLVVGGFMMWRKFKKPKEYVPLQQIPKTTQRGLN
tara:strand:- start:838 stop:1578 length:741 start_codon:yes stop_codon:yes gene_type:complete